MAGQWRERGRETVADPAARLQTASAVFVQHDLGRDLYWSAPAKLWIGVTPLPAGGAQIVYYENPADCGC